MTSPRATGSSGINSGCWASRSTRSARWGRCWSPPTSWIASALDIRCWVNDELRQEANTRDLIFDIPTLIETISAGITLQPGDVIATGTPEGVGAGFHPPRFLQRGDEVAIEIEGIGRLVNDVF